MQTTTLRTISPQMEASLASSDFPALARSFERKTKSTSLQPFVNFRGQMSVGNFSLPVQKFSLRKKDEFLFIENFPVNSFPKIEIVLEEKNSTYEVNKFNVHPSDKTVQGEILYTRLFLMTAETKKCSLHFRDIDFVPFNFSFSDIASEDKKRMFYRAKLFRKLGFLEELFRTNFSFPEYITPDDAKQIEVLFRGVTEGEFSITVDNSITIFNYKISKEDLQNISVSQKRVFSFDFNEDLLVLGKFFPTGKMTFKVTKGSIANPGIVKRLKENDVIQSLRLNIFDHQIHHCFEKYSNSERLLKNKQKLEQFKNILRKEEPESLVDLIDEPLAEIHQHSAMEIIEGLLQFHDFPDRFSVLKPELKRNRWKVPIALTYPKHEPIWLADAFVDVRTGKVEMKLSFDELLKKGKKKAKEVFSIA